MVEARERKAAFLREVSRALKLTDVTVMTYRLEAGSTVGSEHFDIVTLRGIRADVLAPVRPTLAPEASVLWFGGVVGEVPVGYVLQETSPLPGGSKLLRLSPS